MYELLQQLFSPAVVWVFIPITAIAGGIYAGIRKEELKAKAQSASLNNEDKQVIQRLVSQNQDLNERMVNLETIITSMDKEILALKASESPDADRQKVKKLAESMKNDPK